MVKLAVENHKHAILCGMLFMFIFLLSSPAESGEKPSTAGQGNTATNVAVIFKRNDLNHIFKDTNTLGTFVLFDQEKAELSLVNTSRADEKFIPASTFKIANSLIALEEKAVANIDKVVPFDGKPQPIAAWQKDMPMRDAIRVSNVPVYQELARRIGLKRYKFWLEHLSYGNQETGLNLERFWLYGPLKISAIEQVQFLAKLAKRELPLSTGSQDAVIEITRLMTVGSRNIHGKTGWSRNVNPHIGWFVGWVKDKGKIYSYALNMDMHHRSQRQLRKTLTWKFLAEFGLF